MSQSSFRRIHDLLHPRLTTPVRCGAKRSAALAGVLALALSGCDVDPTSPAASAIDRELSPAWSEAASSPTVLAVTPGEHIQLEVGQTVQLSISGLEPVSAAAIPSLSTANAGSTLLGKATPLQVEIQAAPSGRTEVIVASTDTFDPRLLVDSTVTLGRIGGPRVGIAVGGNGNFIKVGGSAGRPMKYYFENAKLSPDGSPLDFAGLVLMATSSEDGAFRGTITGLPAASQAEAKTSWSSTNRRVLTVTGSGIATALAAGDAVLEIRSESGTATVKVTVAAAEVEAKPIEAPPVSFDGDLVVYPSEEVAFLAGPQLKLGSTQNPWPWYDATMLERGPVHADRILKAKRFDNGLRGYTYYYDLGASLYLLYYRTGDVQYRDMARRLVDRFAAEQLPEDGSTPPRSAAMTGVLLRALDGRPELFDYAVMWARRHDRSWLNRFYDTDHTHSGIRDGGFTLLYLAQIAAVHPDPAIRAEFQNRALLGAQWFTRTQAADGAWYYNTGKFGRITQPFQMGFLLEGMVAAHQLTNDASVAASILKATDFLYRDGFDASFPWEALFYSVPESPKKRDKKGDNHPGPKSKADATWGYRHLNSTVVHAFGYAYKISGEKKYLTQGDHLFEAAFGYDPADPKRSTGLAFDNGKNYNQSYRSSGRYLVWRQGR